MSQERTGHDEEIIQRMRYNEAKAYQIGHAFSPEMSAALREIDRLNATIATLNAENEIFRGDVADQDELIRQQEAEMHRRNGVIIDLQRDLGDLTAKVQERDEQAIKLRLENDWLRDDRKKEAEKGMKEIERLRAVLTEAREDLFIVASAGYHDAMVKEAEEAAARIDAALKGAEQV